MEYKTVARSKNLFSNSCFLELLFDCYFEKVLQSFQAKENDIKNVAKRFKIHNTSTYKQQ